jgi:hypothetical protein
MANRKFGSTSVKFRLKLRHATTGAGLGGLLYSSAGLIISTILDNEATATAYTQAASNIEDITTLGTWAAPTSGKCRFKEVDSTNHLGLYEFQFANARFSVAGSKVMVISVRGAANLLDADYEVDLTQFGLDDAQTVRVGTLDAGSTSMAQIEAGGPATTNAWRHMAFTVTHAATGLTETRIINTYNGTTKQFAFYGDAFLEACAAGDAYRITVGAASPIEGTPDMNLVKIAGSADDVARFQRGLRQVITGIVTEVTEAAGTSSFRITMTTVLGHIENLDTRQAMFRTGNLNHKPFFVDHIEYDAVNDEWEVYPVLPLPVAPDDASELEFL